MRFAIAAAFTFACGWTFGPLAIDYARAQVCSGISGFLTQDGPILIGNLIAMGPDCQHLQDGGPSTGSLNPTFQSVTINPIAGNNSALTINQTLSGGTGSNKNYTSMNIASDNVNCAFCTDFEDTHFFGGPLAAGTRIGAFYNLVQTAATNPAQPGGNSLRVYLGGGGLVQTNTGDGGTGLGSAQALGTYFGWNPIVRNSGTNIFNMWGEEIDVQSAAGSSARYSTGSAIVNYEAVQGTSLDSAITIYSGGSIAATGGAGPWGPGVGFHNGITFAELNNGLVPLDAGASVLSTHLETIANIPVTNGIDLRGFLISGLEFAANGITINPTGNVDINRNANPGSVQANAPNTGLRYAAIDGGLGNFLIDTFANVPAYIGRRAGGTANAKANVNGGDLLAQFTGEGYTTAGAYTGQIVGERMAAAETFTSSAQGTFVDWITTKNGTLVTAAQMKLDGFGHLDIGQGILLTGSNLSACGAGPAISATATDVHGTITMGTGTTGCTLTFANARSAAPDCVVIDATGTLAAMSVTPSAAQLVIAGAAASNKIIYNCLGL